MSDIVRLSRTEAEALAVSALVASRTLGCNALATARALVAAECSGQRGHGLSRLPVYAAQARSGKVNGEAIPLLCNVAAAALSVDACGGFAYPALDLATAALVRLARKVGVASVAIRRSHHAGQFGLYAERVAEAGLVAMAFANTPQAMAFHGGSRPKMGTNPIAFAAPLPNRPPLVIDMALSVVARSRIVAAEQAGQSIPPDWAVDKNGQSTTDPANALGGALAPIGGTKGAALAMAVEILCGALAGGHYGWEASSFLEEHGASPSVGQFLVAIDPSVYSDDFLSRMGDLIHAVADEGARLPGDSRLASRALAESEGIAISATLHSQISRIFKAGYPV